MDELKHARPGDLILGRLRRSVKKGEYLDWFEDLDPAHDFCLIFGCRTNEGKPHRLDLPHLFTDPP